MKKQIFILLAIVIGTISGSAQDVSRDIELGKQGYNEVITNLGLYSDPKVEQFLKALGKRLVAQLNPPLFTYQFYLVDSEEPNAFSLPGGKIFVTRGLLALPLSEDELAGVIGHEIIHSQNRHSIKQQRNSIWGALVALPGLVVGGIVQGPAGEAIATPFVKGGLLINAQYSQGHENEADKQGIALAAAAGYNPASLADFLTRLNKEVELITGEAEIKSSFSSHPFTPKRKRNIVKESATLTPVKTKNIIPADSLLFLFDGILLSENPELGYIENDVLYQPKNNFQIDVPNGWEHTTIPDGIGLLNADKDIMVSIMFEKDSLKATEYLDQLRKKIQLQSGSKPTRNESFEWYGNKGGVLEYQTQKNGKEVVLQLFVADYGSVLIKLGGLFYAEKKDELGALLRTAKPSKQNAMPSTQIKVLRVSAANGGETLEEFVASQNATEFLAAIEVLNDKTADAICKKGEPIKWIEKTAKTFN
jgi:predicted Zn-dependent protease